MDGGWHNSDGGNAVVPFAGAPSQQWGLAGGMGQQWGGQANLSADDIEDGGGPRGGWPTPSPAGPAPIPAPDTRLQAHQVISSAADEIATAITKLTAIVQASSGKGIELQAHMQQLAQVQTMLTSQITNTNKGVGRSAAKQEHELKVAEVRGKMKDEVLNTETRFKGWGFLPMRLCHRPMTCKRGDDCPYAHSAFELHPSAREHFEKEKMAKRAARGADDGPAVVVPDLSRFRAGFRPKKMCSKILQKGGCILGSTCGYAHDQAELHPDAQNQQNQQNDLNDPEKPAFWGGDSAPKEDWSAPGPASDTRTPGAQEPAADGWSWPDSSSPEEGKASTGVMVPPPKDRNPPKGPRLWSVLKTWDGPDIGRENYLGIPENRERAAQEEAGRFETFSNMYSTEDS